MKDSIAVKPENIGPGWVRGLIGIVAISVVYVVMVRLTMEWRPFLGFTVLVLPGFLFGMALTALAFWWRGRHILIGLLAIAVGELLVGAGLLLLGLEGLLSLLMVGPLMMSTTLAGLAAAYLVARWYPAHLHIVFASLVLMASLPLLSSIEAGRLNGAVLHTTRTEILVDAPIEAVWGSIIAPSILAEPRHWLFKWGAGYPIQIHVDGEGVGSWRLDDFPTGTYKMQVTHWEPPQRLVFQTQEQPLPMQNINPLYGEVYPPQQLEIAVLSRQGEFYAVETDDGVLVRATSWYLVAMAPDFYWYAMLDRIIRQIHGVLLEDVKLRAESPNAGMPDYTMVQSAAPERRRLEL